MTTKHENKNKHLYYLNELSDYKIASDDPDVRGWPVKDADNRVIGKVDNLLVNKTTERVVYLDVEVDSSIIAANHDPYGQPANSDVHEFINREGENHIIIPVGLVSLNSDQDFVYTDRINYQTFAETKRIQKGSAVNREYEVVVLDSYDRNYNRDERNYEKDSFSDRETHRGETPISNRDVVDEERRNREFESGRDMEDDSFYKRREFDRTNYRKNR